ncbi:hypothetical protein HK104_004359, partial [Borealophlyctis nickersoniae]
MNKINIFNRKSPITLAIDNATAETLPEVDKGYLESAVSMVLRNPDGTKEAFKAIKKRLKCGHPVGESYALSALDNMVHTCGAKFRVEVVDNLPALYKISAEWDRDNRLHFLQIISRWKTLDPGMIGPVNKVEELFRRDGYDIPDDTANQRTAALQYTSPDFTSRVVWPPEQQQFQTFEMRKEQIEHDILLANNNVAMFLEALNFLAVDEDPQKNDLVQEFRFKCSDIQRRTVVLIQQIDDAELIGKLIKVKEDIDVAMKSYQSILDERELAHVLEMSRETASGKRAVSNMGVRFNEPPR